MSRSARACLGWLVVLAAAAGLAGGLAGAPAGAQTEVLSPAERERAATIYASQCATCHGADARGGVVPATGDPVPALAGNPAVTVAYLDLVMRTGRMPPPEDDPYDNRARDVVLTDEERRIVVAYLADAVEIAGELPDPPPGNAARGREVYATNCAQCHGSTGAGGVAGAGAWTPAVNDKLPVTIAEAVRVGPFEMPAFDAEQISDQEVGDIAAFLAEVAAETGTPIGLLELNPVYASGIAALFSLAVVLSLLWIAGRPTWFPDPRGQRRGAPRTDPVVQHGGDADKDPT